MKFRIGSKRKGQTCRFNDILPDIIHEYDLEKSFTIEELISQWHTIVGDIISTHSKPDRIFRKTLFVAADHSVYANEIVMMKDAILRKTRDVFPYQPISDLKVEIKTIYW